VQIANLSAPLNGGGSYRLRWRWGVDKSENGGKLLEKNETPKEKDFFLKKQKKLDISRKKLYIYSYHIGIL